MEGRDIGTTVFPQADVKVYLDAEPGERARRRAGDPAHHGQATSIAAVATALEQRDTSDRTRGTSPLAIADDAVHIDTTHMAIADVVDRVLSLARSRALAVARMSAALKGRPTYFSARPRASPRRRT
jgi:cytidylate kinase